MKTIQLLVLASCFMCSNPNFATGQNVDDCIVRIFDQRHRLTLGQVDEYEDNTFRYKSSLAMLEAYQQKADSVKDIISKAKLFDLAEKSNLLTLVSLAVNEVSGDTYEFANKCESALILNFDKLVAIQYIYELERKYIKEKRIRDDAVSWARNLCQFVIQEKKVDFGIHPKDLPPLASDAEIKFYNLKKREVIADIGPKLGTFEHNVAKLGKKLSVFVCEMHGLWFDQLKTRLTVHQVIRDNGTTFKCILTTKESFDLPQNVLDKAMIRSNFHDFFREEWILVNVKKSLKKGGKLFITDIVSEDDRSSSACPNLLSKQRLLQFVESHGFNLVGETKLPNSARTCFVFRLR